MNATTQNTSSEGARPSRDITAKKLSIRQPATLAELNGVRSDYPAREIASIPEAEGRLLIPISTWWIDRWEGLARTESMWGSEANERVLTAGLSTHSVRKEVADFFQDDSLKAFASHMVVSFMFRPAETAYDKAAVFASLDAVAGGRLSRSALDVVTELVLPFLIKIKLVSNGTLYSRYIAYGFNRVVVADLRHDIIMQNLLKAAQSVSLKDLDFESPRISKIIFGERLANALRPLGTALSEMADLVQVVDDIVVGVAAHIDPLGRLGRKTEAVPKFWSEHAVVKELARNAAFVREALRLPKTDLKLTSDLFRLDKFAVGVLGWLKTSERFGYVGREEVLRHYESASIKDMRGISRSIIINRRVETHAMAQNVVLVESQVGSVETLRVTESRDSFKDTIQAAYGSAPFGTHELAVAARDAMSTLVEQGWVGPTPGLLFDAEGHGATLADLALMRASDVYVQFDENGIHSADEETAKTSRDWDPKWWFLTATNDRTLVIKSGRHLGDAVLTSSPMELLMAVPDLATAEPVPTRPQGLGDKAFDSVIVGADKNALFTSANAKFKFEFQAFKKRIAGAIRATDFAILSGIEHTSLVRPSFNSAVFAGIDGAFGALIAIGNAYNDSTAEHWADGVVGTSVAISTVESQRPARVLLDMSQSISETFRNEVHRLLIEQAIINNKLEGGEIIRFRAEMGDKVFGSMADVVAFRFFLFLQGIETPHIEAIIASPAMEYVCLTHGSTRKNLYTGGR